MQVRATGILGSLCDFPKTEQSKVTATLNLFNVSSVRLVSALRAPSASLSRALVSFRRNGEDDARRVSHVLSGALGEAAPDLHRFEHERHLADIPAGKTQPQFRLDCSQAMPPFSHKATECPPLRKFKSGRGTYDASANDDHVQTLRQRPREALKSTLSNPTFPFALEQSGPPNGQPAESRSAAADANAAAAPQSDLMTLPF